MLKRIKISGYKSFQNLELRLEPLSVIFGPNASGKSNLLDALYLLSRMVSCRNFKEAFEGHRGLPLESFFYAGEGYESLLKKESVSFSFEVDAELSPSVKEKVGKIVAEKRRGVDERRTPRTIRWERFLRYRVVVEGVPATGYLRVRDERLAALKANGEEKRSRAPFIERVGNGIHLRMEGQAHPTQFDLGLDHTIVSTPLYEPHYPHINAFRTELENWMFYYLEPRTLMREETPIAEVRSLGPLGQGLAAFLNLLRIENERAYRNFNLTLRSVLPSATSIQVELLKEKGTLGLRLSEDGITYSARLLSEGTLRLLGFLAAIHPFNPATLIGFEEPENGIHPVRLKLIAEMLKAAASTEKQIIVTTHSPRFPRNFENKSLFVCRKENNVTKIESLSSWGPLFFRGEIEQALEERIVRGDFGG